MFKLCSGFRPTGDQPEAVSALYEGLKRGEDRLVLQGVTGSGKTFTMANLIAKWNRPTLVISHNKTLAAQLYAELKEFFPENAVEYFISYYDYYQPEAYIPQTDTYIEKDAAINEEIERYRLAATNALIARRDVVVVSSVSCIYGLGESDEYRDLAVRIETGADGRERLAKVHSGDSATWRYFNAPRAATKLVLRVVPRKGGIVELRDGNGASYGRATVPGGDGKAEREVSITLDRPFPAGRNAVVLGFHGRGGSFGGRNDADIFDVVSFRFFDH